MNRGKIIDLANLGALGRVGKFQDTQPEWSAVEMVARLSSKGKSNAPAVSGLASKSIRSLELWWDRGEGQLKVVACARADDIDAYGTALSGAFEDVQISPAESSVPEWWDHRLPLYYVDWSWKHGHYALPLAKDSADVLSQLAEYVQGYEHAWVQVSFQRVDASRAIYDHKGRLEHEGKRPERNDDLKKHVKDLVDQAGMKEIGPHVMVSVRCACDPGMLYDGAGKFEEPPLHLTKSKYDHLSPHVYGAGIQRKIIKVGKCTKVWSSIFPLRLLPYQQGLDWYVKRYYSLDILGRPRQRESPPVLLFTAYELPLLLKMLPPGTANLKTTRDTAMLERAPTGRGLSLGRTNKARTSTSEYHGMLGRVVDAKETGHVVLPLECIPTHVYMPGATGHGKSSLIMILAKHFEMMNIRADMQQDVPVYELRKNPEYEKYLGGFDESKTLAVQGPSLETAFIYVDPKGDDAEKFIRACEPYSFKRGRVRLLDPVKTMFSINPLELPPGTDSKERDAAKSRHVGYLTSLLEAWFGDSKTYVRLQRILGVCMQYLYLHTDCPTLADMYAVVRRLQQEGAGYVAELYKEIGEPGEALKDAMDSIANLDKQAFDAVLHRLEPFVIDGFLNGMFCSSRSTVPAEELIRAGSHTVVRLAQSDLPPNIADKAIQAFVLKLWFTVLERADKTRPEDRTQVVLVLDEFQVLKDIGVLGIMIEQARSRGICLVLTHQTLGRLDDGMLNDILGNCGFQMTGRLEGAEAARLSDSWDPHYSQELKQQIPVLPKHCWIAKGTATGGQEQPPPVQFQAHFDKESGGVVQDNMTDQEYDDFVRSQKEGNLARRDARGLLGAEDARKSKWMSQLEHGRLFGQDEWKAMVTTLGGPRTLKEITGVFGGVPREKVSELCGRMVRDGLLQRAGPDGGAANHGGKYALAPEARTKYLSFSPGKIGSAKDIPAITEEVVAWYAERGHFVGMARQGIRPNQDRTDLVAYDYGAGEAISVEIESTSEVNSHPEHVKKNMKKWKQMGFDRCHVWSYSDKIMGIAREFAGEAVKAKQLGSKDAEERLWVADHVKVFRLMPGRSYLSSIVHDGGGPRVMTGQDPLQDAQFEHSGEEAARDSGGGGEEPPSGGGPD